VPDTQADDDKWAGFSVKPSKLGGLIYRKKRKLPAPRQSWLAFVEAPRQNNEGPS